MIEFRTQQGYARQLAIAAILPLFFFGTAMLYDPFGIKAYYSFGDFSADTHLLLISCIIFLVTIISRLLFHVFIKNHEIKWKQYILWCVVETAATAAFAALYTQLFKGAKGEYFSILGYCLKYLVLILCYPYIFMEFIRIYKLQEEEIEKKTAPSDNSLVRFYDEHKRLKLTIAPSSILYVSSEFNYVKIHYLDAGKVREYMLRASMKSLEELDCKCLVRCQRSYFVNPEHVTVLRKNSEGFIYAEMNIPDVPAVPVSKQYYEALSALL